MTTSGTGGKTMADSKNDKHKDYARFAAHCLNVAPIKEQGDEAINREMALEWLKLADAIAHPMKSIK
jgi:hypothetical protein